MATAEEVRQDGIPLSESEKRVWADIEWAEHDAGVRVKYAGQWIAIYDRTVVAHGSDREQVLHQGAEVAQRAEEELAIWPVLSDIAFVSEPPLAASES